MEGNTMQRFISGDSHVDLTWLPPDTFTARAPNQWKNAVPRVVETERGLRWRTEDLDLGGVAGVGPSGSDLAMFQDSDERIHRMVQVGFYDDAAKGLFHPTTVELRLRDQDVDGVDAEVIYGVLGVADKIEDRELAGVVHQIYNDWISDFCKGNESRFAGLACLPNHDSVAAAKELRRASKLGLRGAEISVSTAAKPIYHRDWDVLWETAAELGMPISFHCRGLPARPPAPVDAERYGLEFKAVSSAVFELSAPEALASIILSGACDRHPGFRFVLGESGVSWIPYVLGSMDQHYEDRYRALDLAMKPNDYWSRQGFTTYQKEPFAAALAPLVGAENIMWGSDYPHPAGLWPDSRRIVEENLAGLDALAQRKIVCENTATLYGLP